MPIYEYTCTACGHELEAMQKMSDVPLVDCPECGKPALKKIVSAAGFRLTGTGWYETDFKGGGKKKEDKEKKETTSTTGKEEKKKTTEKSDAKTAKTGTGD
jgi:putative FmdB family regulatory protein